MLILYPIFIIALTIGMMEVLSWALHKYLFHGPLWFIHRSHHRPHQGWFEWNDLFSLAFASLSVGLMWYDAEQKGMVFWIGLGITIYGLIYFILHDWFIHNRFKAFKTNNVYLLGIRRAHKIHHKSLEKDQSEEFGLLVASKKYFRKLKSTAKSQA